MKNHFLTLAALCSLICIGCGGKIPSDPTEAFPDPIFCEYVLDNFDTNGDGKISKEEALAVTKIDVECSYYDRVNRPIKSLEGIQYFTNLEYLTCSHNQLTSLDVSKNTELTTLYCSDNQLTTLDVSKNTALKRLDCYGNQLTSLDVSKNTELTYLYCPDNQLTTLDVSKNTELTDLYCSSNQLTTLDVSKNTELTYLECDYNKLRALDVSKNAKLEWLECNNNQLRALDVSKNTKLEWLWCPNNKIEVLDLSKTNLGYRDPNSDTGFGASMETLKKVYLKKGWSIEGVTEDWNRSSKYIPDHTEIIFVD